MVQSVLQSIDHSALTMATTKLKEELERLVLGREMHHLISCRAIGITHPEPEERNQLAVCKWENWQVALRPETDDEEWVGGRYATGLCSFLETSVITAMFSEAFEGVNA